MANKYLILDSRGNAVARGISEQAPTEKLWRLRIDDGEIDSVMNHTNITLVGDSEAVPALEGKIVQQEENVILVEPVRRLEESVRQNLRIPVRFASYLYPVSGQWKGRVPIVSFDLSCGGLAFFCPRQLEVGEITEVVIPVTSQPLVLPMRILRLKSSQEEGFFFAGRFINLVREEENMVREAVFSLQLHSS